MVKWVEGWMGRSRMWCFTMMGESLPWWMSGLMGGWWLNGWMDGWRDLGCGTSPWWDASADIWPLDRDLCLYNIISHLNLNRVSTKGLCFVSSVLTTLISEVFCLYLFCISCLYQLDPWGWRVLSVLFTVLFLAPRTKLAHGRYSGTMWWLNK